MDITARARADIDALTAPEGWLFAGSGRYECLFGRDSCLSALGLLPDRPDIAASTLRALARTQGRVTHATRNEEPGRIVHEYRLNKDARYDALVTVGWEFPDYGSEDSTPLFVILAGVYAAVKHDTSFVTTLATSLASALAWIGAHLDEERIFRAPRLNATHSRYQNWKDSDFSVFDASGSPADLPTAHLDVQVLVQMAIASAVDMGLALSDDLWKTLHDTAARWPQILDRYRRAPGDFAAALDGHNQPCAFDTTIPSYLLWGGAVEESEAPALATRLCGHDRMTRYGVRGLSTASVAFDENAYDMGTVWPFENWLLWYGLQRYGCSEAAGTVRHAIDTLINEVGGIPELVVVSREGDLRPHPLSCASQAWSAMAALAMHRDVLAPSLPSPLCRRAPASDAATSSPPVSRE